MTETNRKIEPIRPGGGMRRLRSGSLRRAEDRSQTLVSRAQFHNLLGAEIERAVNDEQTVLVMRLRIRPLPGSGDDSGASRSLPDAFCLLYTSPSPRDS